MHTIAILPMETLNVQMLTHLFLDQKCWFQEKTQCQAGGSGS